MAELRPPLVTESVPGTDDTRIAPGLKLSAPVEEFKEPLAPPLNEAPENDPPEMLVLEIAKDAL